MYAARMGSFLLCIEIHPFCTQNRTVPTHQRTPDAQSWCSRLAMDVGEGQNQTSCIDSPMRRRGGVDCSENGVILHENPPFLHIEQDRSDLRMPKAGVPASPWMWAKARIKLAALIRQCGDGAVSNVARMGSFCMKIDPLCT